MFGEARILGSEDSQSCMYLTSFYYLIRKHLGRATGEVFCKIIKVITG